MSLNEARAGVLRSFAAGLGLNFKNWEWLEEALTHSSYLNEHPSSRCNERLEFLGDAVLDVIVSDFLFQYSKLDEGQLTKIRSHFVREESFAWYGSRLHLGAVLQMGKGAWREGDDRKPAVLADTFEALAGAVYKDQGMEAATNFFLGLFQRDIEALCAKGRYSDNMDKNYKSLLQETLQKKGPVQIAYRTLDRTGPDHQPLFRVAVSIAGRDWAEGEGTSRQRAEQEAARRALEKL